MKHRSTTVLFFFVTLFLAASGNFVRAQSRAELLQELQTRRVELQRLESEFLAPSVEDSSNYAAFLSQPDTGLIRLLPRERFDSETYRQNKQTLAMRGGGAYYSFSRLAHEYGAGSDLELDSGYLSVGFAGASYGMLVNLGDRSLDQVSLDYPGVKFLVSYEPPAKESSARQAATQFRQGFTVDQIRYQGRLPVVVNNSYVLRSIDYARSDLLVAFRIVRQDSDGSVVLLWKLLKKYPTPALARAN
jgi:hypothetical protein